MCTPASRSCFTFKRKTYRKYACSWHNIRNKTKQGFTPSSFLPSPSPSPVCVMEYVVYASTRFTNVFIIKDGRTLSLEMWLLSWLRCYDIVLLSYQVWNRMSCLTWKRREWKTWSKVIENKERTEYLLDKMIDQYFSLRSNVCKFFTWILKIYFVSKYWFWWWYLLFLSYKRMIV